jgi:hypothetical protein
MRSIFLLGFFTTLSWSSLALADFNDSVFVTISPKFPLDLSLEVLAENDNEQGAFCNIRVDATYAERSSPEVKRHLLLKTTFFVPARGSMKPLEFGLTEFQNMGIPGVYYADSKIISKVCEPGSMIKLVEHGWYDSLNLEISGRKVSYVKTSSELVVPDDPRKPAMPGAQKTRTCTGELSLASMQTLAEVLNATASQSFDAVYGDPDARRSRSYRLEWISNQGPRSFDVYENPWNEVPEDIAALLGSIRDFQWEAKNCT